MFLCKPCVEKIEGDGHFDAHAGLSRGPCESCEKVADCVDCKCYKGRKF